MNKNNIVLNETHQCYNCGKKVDTRFFYCYTCGVKKKLDERYRNKIGRKAALTRMLNKQEKQRLFFEQQKQAIQEKVKTENERILAINKHLNSQQ